MRPSRKTVTMLIVVTIPEDMPAVVARREVRTLIGEQRNFFADPGDVRLIAVRPAPKELRL